jgi:hypothetical protein
VEQEDKVVIEEMVSDSGELNLGSSRSLCEGLVDEVIFMLELRLGSFLGFAASWGVVGTARRDRGVRLVRLAVWEVDDVNEEQDKRGREGETWKEEVPVGEDTPGGSVSWVCSTRYVFGVDVKDTRGFREEGMNSFEYIVGLVVAMMAVPPAFNDACVVSIDKNISPLRDDGVKSAYEQFKADGFCPADVAVRPPNCLPSWDEFPGSPSLADDDADPHTSASIGES